MLPPRILRLGRRHSIRTYRTGSRRPRKPRIADKPPIRQRLEKRHQVANLRIAHRKLQSLIACIRIRIMMPH